MSSSALKKTFITLMSLGLLALSNQAHAQSVHNTSDMVAPNLSPTILILDGSGSMAGKLNGQKKILTAKKVVSKFLKNWDKSRALGIMAYGHRQKKSCQDIQLVTAPQTGIDRKTYKFIQRLTPKGMTPIGDSILQATKSLSSGGEIIVVTDGIETCQADLCAIAKNLGSQNIKTRIHVVGFGLNKKELSTFQCLTDETGGKLLTSNDHQSLNEALDITRKAPPAYNLIARAVNNKGTLLDKRSFIWHLRPQDAPASEDKLIGTGYQRVLNLKPGPYTITLKTEDYSTSYDVTVQTEGKQTIDIPIGSGRITLTASLTENGTPLKKGTRLGYTIYTNQGKRVAKEAGHKANFDIAPGNYIAEVKLEDMSVRYEFQLKAGEERKKKIPLDAGILEITPYGQGIINILIFDKNKQSKKAVAREATRQGRTKHFILPAGTYRVTTKSKSGVSEFNSVPLTAGQIRKLVAGD
jgi:Ca-activated chloride channel family protein